ncbi:glycosyltransferase family 92 protein [Mucilaginibacter jinjuensis]|uniref:Glycosyltransferase family 92 protein n=1 Tax=Mucilaginibacter jinjuensis TaxID=1176721 RepID=A0ABY7TD85_9SPHI|nr:glycosyltransferase family 92 protein [Mucilaginibacter jinjuensis]WCT14480.1 glycosyltransferase family 92 protein [Mucilaginibacter jinjuensis]
MIKPSHNNQICIVAIAKDEHQFLDEWLIYHRLIGFEKFLVYDNSRGYELKRFSAAHRNYLTVIPWHSNASMTETVNNQIKAYRHALDNFVGEFEWVLFLDIDEFMVLRKHCNIHQFLEDFGHASAITLNWHVFGHNGFYDDPYRLVTISLTKRMRAASPMGKTISKVSQIKSITSPHYCNLQSGERMDANNLVYQDDLYPSKTSIAHINHYSSRSFNRWMSRAARGDVNFNTIKCPDSERWRLTESDLLKEFVTRIAKDHNEIEDEFLVRFKYQILAGINSVKGDPTVFPGLLETDLISRITDQLDQIAELLTKEAHLPGEDDLDHWKSIATFLFHYGRYSANKLLEVHANKITEKASTLISSKSSSIYDRHITEYGVFIECLVQNSFIDADTNEVLQDIDIWVEYLLTINKPDNQIAVLEICKYLVYRIVNRINDPYHPREKLNREILSKAITGINIDQTGFNELKLLIEMIQRSIFYGKSYLTVSDKLEEAFNRWMDLTSKFDGDYEILCGLLEGGLSMIEAGYLTEEPLGRQIASDIQNIIDGIIISCDKDQVDINVNLQLWRYYYCKVKHSCGDANLYLTAIAALEKLLNKLGQLPVTGVSDVESNSAINMTISGIIARAGLGLLSAVSHQVMLV